MVAVMFCYIVVLIRDAPSDALHWPTW